jgi:hemerythrin-like domain-containing protein
MKKILFLMLFLPCFIIASEEALPQETSTIDYVIEVSPVEDLMREHGVLERVLLIYEELLTRLGNKDFPLPVLKKAALIVRNFIENYHEKLEETYIFPKFLEKKTLTDLVDILQKEHVYGKSLTNTILTLSDKTSLQTQDCEDIRTTLHAFISMYRPHKAREDTVLFPTFKTLISVQEYDKLGDLFEDEETRLFGENGFLRVVDEVALLEKQLGIYNLHP